MSLTLRATGYAPQTIDEAEVRRAVSVLCGSGPAVEFRALPSGKSWVKKFDDIDGAIEAVRWMADNDGIYYTINPVGSDMIGLKRAAKKDNIVCRRWLLIDVDAIKPPDTSATEQEHENAQKLAGDVRAWLMAFHKWPEPIIVDSGNGWHLLYRIDLPNDELSRVLCKGALAGIAQQFKDDKRGKVDTAVHDAPRIAKLPGTWSRKGPNDQERPHRICRLVYVPQPVKIVSAEQLRKLHPEPDPVKPVNRIEQWYKRPTFKVVATTKDSRAYVRKAIDLELRNLETAPAGERNKTLNEVAFALFQFTPGGHIDVAELESWLTDRALAIGLTESETKATINSARTAGTKQPRTIPNYSANGIHKSQPNEADREEHDSVLIRANTITPRKIKWLWNGRIPMGKLTTFAGATSVGKTFALCDITARVSRGSDWPDSNGECCEPGHVIFITGEDDPDDTLVPRLIELNADLDRISFLRTEVQDRFSLADLELLDRAVSEAGPTLKLICIDPPTAFLGDVDDHKNAELRQVLSPLKSWAARNDIAIVFITHVNKQSGQKVEAIMRVIGSVAWINAVRAAHMFAKDPEDPERRLFCCMKMNIAKEPKGLAYRMIEKGDSATIEWLGEVDTTADEAVGRVPESTKKKIQVNEWLIERFREKLEWASDDIKDAGREAGIGRNALFEAKKALDIPARRVVTEKGDVMWRWVVPPNWPPLTHGDPIYRPSATKCREVREVDVETF